jgi:hypothetical protein
VLHPSSGNEQNATALRKCQYFDSQRLGTSIL